MMRTCKGGNAGSTLVILKQGDMLTIRSIAGGQEIARRNIDLLMVEAVPAIVGRLGKSVTRRWNNYVIDIMSP